MSFYFYGIALSSDGIFFSFSQNCDRNGSPFGIWGIKELFEMFLEEIQSTRPTFLNYEISYNANNLTANYICQDFQKTIVCSLYSSNQLRVETFINHNHGDLIENQGDYIYNFMSLDEIQKGISQSVEDSLYPIRTKKRWWEI